MIILLLSQWSFEGQSIDLNSLKPELSASAKCENAALFFHCTISYINWLPALYIKLTLQLEFKPACLACKDITITGQVFIQWKQNSMGQWLKHTNIRPRLSLWSHNHHNPNCLTLKQVDGTISIRYRQYVAC